jgi:hydroxymethylglutaryl-CoA reductase
MFNCIVRAEVCAVDELAEKVHHNPLDFAQRFVQASQIAEVEPLELTQ